MSKVATKNITFWNTTGYNYPGFGKSTEVPDGLGGTVGITYNQMDYNDRTWKAKPDGNVPVTEDRFLSGEIENNFSLIGEVKAITATMPLIRTLGSENNYSVTLDFSKYKASAGGSKASDGATSGDTYLAISRFFNGSKAGYTTIKVTAITLDGSELNLGDWKLFNSGTLGQGNNARIFLDAATQIISGKNSLGKQEFCPTPPNPGSSFGTDTGLGLFELPSNQRYVSITLNFKQKKITGPSPNDLHNIYVASNTSSTSPIDETPPPPMDINRGLQLHLLLNEIVENAESEKEVVDISGAQLNGKVDGATVVADSKFGHCINFDGVDDYIQMPEMNVDYSQGLTVAAWVHYNSFKRWSRIIDFGNAQANDNIVFGNQLTTNNLALVVLKGSNDNRIKADGRLELNQWLYVTVTVDGSGSGKIYKNGEEVQSGLVHLPNTVNRTKNYIGKSNWSADKYFHGQMSNLRLYNRGLSKAEINECMKVDVTPPPSMAGEDDTTPTTDGTETTSTNGEDGTTPTTDGTETTSTTGDNDTTPTTDDIETTPTTNEGNTDPTSTAGEDDVDSTTDGTEATPTTGEGNTDATSTTDGTNPTPTTNEGNTDPTSTTGEDDVDSTTDGTETTPTTGEGNTDATSTTDGTDTTSTTDGTDTTSTTDGTNPTPTPDGTDTTQKPTDGTDTTSTTDGTNPTPTTNEGNTDPTSTTGEDDVESTTDVTETTPTTGEGNTDATSTTDGTDTTSTTDGTDTTSTTDGTDTTQKPMEYKIYQVKGNPTIKTGYPASEWTAILAGFNCGAKQKHKATALTIMPFVDDGEWKIKCDIKDADDRYWDVAVLFIRNNMVNRLSNFYR